MNERRGGRGDFGQYVKSIKSLIKNKTSKTNEQKQIHFKMRIGVREGFCILLVGMQSTSTTSVEVSAN